MGKEKKVLPADLARTANRQINLSYILAGCLGKSLEDANDYLIRSNSYLKHANKLLLSDIIRSNKKLIYLIDKLKEQAIYASKEPENKRLYDDSVVKYYSLFMRFVQVAGADEYFGIRSYVLISILNEFIPHIDFPNLDNVEIKAWSELYIQVVEGKWPSELVEKLMPKFSKDEIEAAKAECKI